MFTEALFIIAKTWKPPKCPWTVEWIKNIYIYTYTIFHCVCIYIQWNIVFNRSAVSDFSQSYGKAPLSMRFSRQEYWSGFLFPPPGESSWPRDWTQDSWVSCIGKQIPYHWATWEAHSGTWLRHKKEWNNVICSNIDAPRDYHPK